MELSSNIKNDIVILATKKFSNSEKDEFFTRIYPNFNVYDQSKIITIFQQDMSNFIHYLNNSEHKKVILEQLKKGISQFLEDKEFEKSIDLLSIILAYINLDEPPFEDKLISEAFKKINLLICETSIIKCNTLEEILKYYTKLIAYSSFNKEMYDSLLQSENFKEYEKIICNYIKNLKSEEIINNELINLLVEIAPAINSFIIESLLKSQIDECIDLSKYDDFIVKMIPLDKNVDMFLNDIKRYRIQNGIIPENVCVYINKFYNSNDKILRLCNIDYMRHYLIKNGTENISVFYDNLMDLSARGLAGPAFLSLKEFDLNVVMFHEAVHVIQYNNIQTNRNFTEYYYSMLKDFILQQKLEPTVYNRNHNRYLFEIDADTRGGKEYYKFLKQIGLLSDKDTIDKIDKLDEKEKQAISLSNFLNIGGYYYDKGEIFDSVLSEDPELLEKYPILKIEYEDNGNKKNMIDILSSLEYESTIHKRSDQEIISISKCIFGESYLVDDIPNLLNQLNNFVPTTEVVLQIGKQLIKELEIYNNEIGNNNEQHGKKN